MDNRIFVLADRLKAAKDKKKELEAQVKELNNEISLLDSQLSDVMAEEECEKFSRNGSTFFLSSRLFASPIAGKKAEMLAVMRDKGFGDLITENVNANTLSSFVKEQMSQNNDEIPEWITQVVNAYERISVGIRKG